MLLRDREKYLTAELQDMHAHAPWNQAVRATSVPLFVTVVLNGRPFGPRMLDDLLARAAAAAVR